ncbi:RNA-dependent ATPase [Lambiella insularis]|nr:RNA-dependent ATPase [Lambiella insularis]
MAKRPRDEGTSKASNEGRRVGKKHRKSETTPPPNKTIALSGSALEKTTSVDKTALKAINKTERALLLASDESKSVSSELVDAARTTRRLTDAAEARGAADRKAKKARVKALGKSARQPGTVPYIESPVLAALPQSDIDAFLASNFISVSDPTPSKLLRPIISFSHLPTSAPSKASPFEAFKKPTPIQSAAWPFLFAGRDVIGIAETGSGKTLAFGVPCIRYISSVAAVAKNGTSARAVIVSPTRELAVQIHDQIVHLAAPVGLKAVCVYGGVPKDTQRLSLKTADIIVATPGRLNDFINDGTADLGNVGYLVLDEADRMLDKGFEEEVRKIISTTPCQLSANGTGRQTLMFTATWPSSIREIASTFMRSPVKITIGDNPTGELRANTSITQRVEVVSPYDKEPRLLQLLKQHSPPKSHTRILVFCLYKKEATRVENFLRSKGMKVAGIHGDLSQEKRSASLEAFKRENGTPILVATDVAARGLDIPAVKVVINVTFPLTVEDYVHRIGRTGRAGAAGLAITLFTDHDKAQSGALINVLKAAGQPVPEELLKFGTTVKKKTHEAYGAFYKDSGDVKAATKIRFE